MFACVFAAKIASVNAPLKKKMKVPDDKYDDGCGHKEGRDSYGHVGTVGIKGRGSRRPSDKIIKTYFSLPVMAGQNKLKRLFLTSLNWLV